MFTVPSGIWYAQNNKFEEHRICMIWTAAGLFLNPVQRFLWFAGTQLNSPEWFLGGVGGGHFAWLTTAERLPGGLMEGCELRTVGNGPKV
jgi:hypothetical protein